MWRRGEEGGEVTNGSMRVGSERDALSASSGSRPSPPTASEVPLPPGRPRPVRYSAPIPPNPASIDRLSQAGVLQRLSASALLSLLVPPPNLGPQPLCSGGSSSLTDLLLVCEAGGWLFPLTSTAPNKSSA